MKATDFSKELTASGIAPMLSEAATYVHENLSHEIYGLLNRKIYLNGHTVPHDFSESLVFANEDGTVWQIKPSRPMVSAKGKAQKYLCPTGSATGPYLPAVPQKARLLFTVPSEGSFWDHVEADTSKTIVLTEGGKKSLSLISNGILAIALTGCDGSTVKTPDGESMLDPRLSRFFNGNRTIVIAMDSDVATSTVSRVSRSIDKLASRIAAYNPECIVRVAKWEPKDGKGADDVIVSRGATFMRDLIKGARRLSISPTFLEPTSPDAIYTESKQGPRLKGINLLTEIVQLHIKDIAWDLETSQFWLYNKTYTGVWSPMDFKGVEINGLIDETLQALTPPGVVLEWNDKTTKSIANLLAGRSIGQKIGSVYNPAVTDREGKQLARLIPMTNGVLNAETRELLPHCPTFGHTHRLPYAYNALALAMPKTREYLDFAQDNDESRVQCLRAFLKALITGQASSFQRFLEVIGAGGTGKSTFVKLMEAMVGTENIATSSFDEITGRFSMADLKGKMLLVLPDCENFISSKAMAKIRQLSGQDRIRGEIKCIQGALNIVFGGLLVLTANEPFKNREATTASAESAISRRRATVYFDRKAAKIDRNLINVTENHVSGTLANELPALFNWVLTMDDQDMENYVTMTNEMCPSIIDRARDLALATNPLAQWASQSLVFSPEFTCVIGISQKLGLDTVDGRINTYANADQHLYPNYLRWCDQTGTKALSLNQFAKNLDTAVGALDQSFERKRGATRWIEGMMLGNPDTQVEPGEITEDFEYEEVAEQLEATFAASPSLARAVTIDNQPIDRLTNEGIASTIVEQISSQVYENATHEVTIDNPRAVTNGSSVL